MRVRVPALAAVIAAVGFLVIGAFAAEASAYGPPPPVHASISVNVSQTPAGVVTLFVTGKNFEPGESVLFTATAPTYTIGSATASSTGTLSLTMGLPAGYAAGTHTLMALGTVSGRTASATFTLAVASQGLQPCDTSWSSAPHPGIQLAAFYSAPCLNTATPGASSSGGSPSAPAASPTGSSSALPFTGADVAALTAVAATALCLGGLLVLSSRRRRRDAWVRQ